MRSIKAFLTVFSLIFLSLPVAGQTGLTDSLEKKLPGIQGKEKVDVLNRLTYEFITNDNAKVLAYNKQALDLSKQISYHSGEARAYTYLGVHEYLSGQISEGHRDLNTGLRLARNAGDVALAGYAFLQLGNCSLEEVQMDSALFFFSESRKVFKDSADPATLSKLYRNIGALYGQRYQTDSQLFYFDRAIRIRKLLPDKTLFIEALVSKVNAKIAMNEFAEAETLLREAETQVTSHPVDDENRNDIRRMKALILFQKGKFDAAIVLFDSARNYFFKKSLLRKYVTLLIDLGKVFTERGEYELALGNLYDALKLSELQHFDADASIVRTQIGWIYQHLSNIDEALRMADEALTLSPDRLPRADLANALTLKGVVLTDRKEYGQARVFLDSVLRIYEDVGSRRGKSEILMKLGVLESRRKNYRESIELYRESVQLANDIRYNYGLAWSYWGLGDVYFKLGDYRNATISLDQSQQYASREGLNEVMVLNYSTRRDLLVAQNRFREALQFSVLASQLRDSIHRTDVARRFLNLEKIEEIEQRDRDIQVLQKDKLLAVNKLSLQEAKLKQQSILLIAGFAGLLLLSALAWVYYRFYSRIKVLNGFITAKNTRIQAQADELQKMNMQLKSLYGEVSEQKEEIQVQADKLSESNRKMSDVNRSLEKLVAEKTVELKKTNEELIKHNRELLQFSYTVSHNLRGPVARLLGLAELMSMEQDLDLAKQMISFIGKTAADLDLIIKDLSKVLELRNEPHQYLESVQLEKEWAQSQSLLQDSLTGNEEIVANFDALPEITTVRAMLQSIFYNLLSNAIKYRSPERSLRIVATSHREGKKAVLEVTDNGVGLNINLHKDNLFKLYKRFHTHVEGRGLGLYLIKSQVDVLHGSIEMMSEPGQGSVFRVILPLSDELLH